MPAAVQAPLASTPSLAPASWKRAFTSRAHAAASFGFASVAACAVVSVRSIAAVASLLPPPLLPLLNASKSPPDVAPPMPNSTSPPPIRMARLR